MLELKIETINKWQKQWKNKNIDHIINNHGLNIDWEGHNKNKRNRIEENKEIR